MSRANKATALGLAFSILTPLFFYIGEKSAAPIKWWAVAVECFIISMFLDAVDGHLARLDGTASEIGGTIDNIRDKISVTMLLLPLASLGLIHWSFVLVITIREFAISGVRIIYSTMENIRMKIKPAGSNDSPENKETEPKPGVSAKIWGKLKTVSLSIAGVFFSLALFNYNDTIQLEFISRHITPFMMNKTWQEIHLAMQWIVFMISWGSGIHYGILYKQYIYEAFMDIIENEKEKNLKHQTGPQPVVKEE